MSTVEKAPAALRAEDIADAICFVNRHDHGENPNCADSEAVGEAVMARLEYMARPTTFIADLRADAAPGTTALPALDEAWKAAEAALPDKTWWFELWRRHIDFNDPSTAYGAQALGPGAKVVDALGPTPAEALQALASRLATTTEETTDG